MLFIFFCQLKETKTGNFTLEFLENFQVYDFANIGMRQPREKLNAEIDITQTDCGVFLDVASGRRGTLCLLIVAWKLCR